jgi:hypothetical protein
MIEEDHLKQILLYRRGKFPRHPTPRAAAQNPLERQWEMSRMAVAAISRTAQRHPGERLRLLIDQ